MWDSSEEPQPGHAGGPAACHQRRQGHTRSAARPSAAWRGAVAGRAGSGGPQQARSALSARSVSARTRPSGWPAGAACPGTPGTRCLCSNRHSRWGTAWSCCRPAGFRRRGQRHSVEVLQDRQLRQLAPYCIAWGQRAARRQRLCRCNKVQMASAALGKSQPSGAAAKAHTAGAGAARARLAVGDAVKDVAAGGVGALAGPIASVTGGAVGAGAAALALTAAAAIELGGVASARAACLAVGPCVACGV